MKDTLFDAKLVAATNRRSDETNNFVEDTMKKINVLHNAASSAKHQPTTLWQRFIHAPLPQRMALGIVAAAVVSIASFSGYAYAIGTDPLSLIKRWVEGDRVHIEYNGRHFEHGTSHNYSDAAVTALAEANTAEGLAFRAKNANQVPKDGVEYVSLPPSVNQSDTYDTSQYPYFATITSVTSQNVTILKQYVWGDKMNPSHDVSETISIPTTTFRYFVKGEPLAASSADAGKLVMVFPETSIRHTIGTNQVSPETNYFSFALSHSLESFKEVGKKGPIEQGKDAVLFEPNWGGLSDICLNNGADTCDIQRFSQRENQGLYPITKGPNQGMSGYNQEAIRSGEGVGPGGQQPENLISRNIMGEIVSMDDTTITVKTSSGAQWRLAYSKSQRDTFTNYHKSELKQGDRIAGQVLESIYNLDNRDIKASYIKSLERYQ